VNDREPARLAERPHRPPAQLLGVFAVRANEHMVPQDLRSVRTITGLPVERDVVREFGYERRFEIKQCSEQAGRPVIELC
jgi:hypothetical protein